MVEQNFYSSMIALLRPAGTHPLFSPSMKNGTIRSNISVRCVQGLLVGGPLFNACVCATPLSLWAVALSLSLSLTLLRVSQLARPDCSPSPAAPHTLPGPGSPGLPCMRAECRWLNYTVQRAASRTLLTQRWCLNSPAGLLGAWCSHG